jgi:flagellar hook-length control protein FliK
MRIAPLRLDADGVHRLTVNLHPADLGPVQVVAEIRNGSVSVQLSGATEAGNDALRNAMDDLRRELEQSGFSNTTLDLRQGQQDQPRQQFGFMENGRDDTSGGRGPAAGAEAAPAEPAAPPATGPDADGRLDIQA